MFNLIPWKKREKSGAVAVRRAEPTRQDIGWPLPSSFWEEFDTILNRLFDDAWFAPRGSGLPRLWGSPRFDWDLGAGWKDEANEYVFHAELPGFEPEDFDVQVSGNTLTVRAEHQDEKRHKKGSSSYCYGSFVRTFTMPHGVDAEKIDARYHSGSCGVSLAAMISSTGSSLICRLPHAVSNSRGLGPASSLAMMATF